MIKLWIPCISIMWKTKELNAGILFQRRARKFVFSGRNEIENQVEAKAA